MLAKRKRDASHARQEKERGRELEDWIQIIRGTVKWREIAVVAN